MVRVRGLTGWFLGTACETKNGHAFVRVRVRNVGKLHFASNFHANDKNIRDTRIPSVNRCVSAPSNRKYFDNDSID